MEYTGHRSLDHPQRMGDTSHTAFPEDREQNKDLNIKSATDMVAINI